MPWFNLIAGSSLASFSRSSRSGRVPGVTSFQVPNSNRVLLVRLWRICFIRKPTRHTNPGTLAHSFRTPIFQSSPQMIQLDCRRSRARLEPSSKRNKLQLDNWNQQNNRTIKWKEEVGADMTHAKSGLLGPWLSMTFALSWKNNFQMTQIWLHRPHQLTWPKIERE